MLRGLKLPVCGQSGLNPVRRCGCGVDETVEGLTDQNTAASRSRCGGGEDVRGVVEVVCDLNPLTQHSEWGGAEEGRYAVVVDSDLNALRRRCGWGPEKAAEGEQVVDLVSNLNPLLHRSGWGGGEEVSKIVGVSVVGEANLLAFPAKFLPRQHGAQAQELPLVEESPVPGGSLTPD